MNLVQYVKLQLERGYDIVDLNGMDVYATCCVAKNHKKLRNIKPQKVQIQVHKGIGNLLTNTVFLQAMEKTDISTVHNIIENDKNTWDDYLAILRLGGYIKLLKYKRGGQEVTSTQIQLLGSVIHEDKITDKEDLDIKVFETLEDAELYYKEKRKKTIEEIESKKAYLIEKLNKECETSLKELSK